MTLDEFQKKADEAAKLYKASVLTLLEEAVEAKLDEKIVVAIIEQSFVKAGEAISE